jgi:hypothetical protein
MLFARRGRERGRGCGEFFEVRELACHHVETENVVGCVYGAATVGVTALGVTTLCLTRYNAVLCVASTQHNDVCHLGVTMNVEFFTIMLSVVLLWA